ncbi:class I SAM-dependent methyltransferase [Dyadobacter pollutisoli]|uniref:Class I SAM-dependent methyltransferase n=1 Tax=Dyadobacter pollutisoli TaxID=2910158 RepID=A0A9E8NG37_9BACT|nr:class I SAM-dependent methyltransferase [Dyadobacter pollutisoli]WAC13449.1 class I SAM-dependent methyltransferase [Dyadobacter pollutisoli]
MNDQLKKHWEDVYHTKSPYEVSWTEPKPERSLKLIHNTQAPKNSPIIDIGGGDSLLVDYLLDEGYSDITVLDISAKAIERAKNRLGEKAAKITWLVSDILHFEPEKQYSVWHDRATFHFLTTVDRKSKYRYLVENAVADGHLIMGTFSLSGPGQCSGLAVCQYDISALADVFKGSFEVKSHFYADHLTPFQTSQNFLFADFIKVNN